MEMQVSSYVVQGFSLAAHLEIDANPEQVFAALTTGVATWWDASHLESRKLARNLILEPRLGGRLYETWEEPSTDRDGALLATVIQIRRGQILKLLGQFGAEELNAHSIASFKLLPNGGKTTLVFNFESMSKVQSESASTFQTYWGELLTALKQHVEHHHTLGLRSDPAYD